jgi:hypothetical protein
VSWVCLLCNSSPDWPGFKPATDDLCLWFVLRLIRNSSKARRARLCRQDLSLRQLKIPRSERLNSDALRYLAGTGAMSTECHDTSPISYAAQLAGLAGYAITQLSRAGLKLDAINFPGFALIILRRDAYARISGFVHLSRPRFSVAR